MTQQSPATNSRSLYAWLLAGVAAALVGVLAAVVLCLQPMEHQQLIACWTDHLHTPLIADNLAARSDKQSLCAAAYFDVQGTSIDALAKGLVDQHADSQVIYISAYATRGRDGEVLLLTEDFDPLTARNGVAFEALLRRIESDPTPKLLVLDLSWELAEGLAGMLPCDVGREVHERLRATPLKNCLTLVSCAAGESPTRIEGVGRTTFGYFFEMGLAGAADSCNESHITDGRVTALELANYVTERVTRWSRRHGAETQSPKTYHHGDTDLTLAPARRAELVSAESQTPEPYPDWLVEGWRRRDSWKASGEAFVIPRLVKRYEAELIEAESRWRWGVIANHSERWETNCRTVLQEIESAQKRLAATPVVSLAQLTTPANQDYLQAWLAWFAATDKQAAAGVFSSAVDGASYTDLAQAAALAIAESGEQLRDGLIIATDELARRSSSPHFIEVADLRMLAEVAKKRSDAETSTLAEFLRVATLRSQVGADYDLPAALVAELDIANQNRQSAWAALVSPGFASLNDARAYNRQAMRGYQAIVSRQRLYHRAQLSVDRALDTLPSMAPLLRVLSRDRNDWTAALRYTDQLLSMLQAKTGQNDDAIDATTGRLEQRLERLTQIASVEAVALLADEVRDGDAKRAQLADALLATPLLAADERATLVSALREAAAQTAALLYAFAHEPHGVEASNGLPPSFQEATRTEDLAKWEAEMALATLRLARLSQVGPKRVSDALCSPAELRMAIKDAQVADLSRLSPSELRCACFVLPPRPFQPLLDKQEQTPTLVGEIAQREAWARRYASRIFDAAKDLQDPSPYLDLARRLDANVATKTAWLRVNGATDGTPVSLAGFSSSEPTVSLPVRVDHSADESPIIEVLQPADCLRIRQEVRRVPSGSEVQLTLQLRDDATVVQQLATHGVLLRVRRGDVVTHRRIATPGVASVSPVELLVEIAGVSIPWSDRIELPPTSGPTPLRLIAVNHSDRCISLQAEVDTGVTLHAETQIEAGSEKPLIFAPLAPPAEGAATAEVLPSLAVTLRDGAAELMKGTAVLGVAEPASYLRLRDARYVNDGVTAPRLRFIVERLEASPSPISLLWTVANERSQRGPVVRGGTLAATLTTDSPVATLEAEVATGIGSLQKLNAVATINGVVGALTVTSDSQIGTRSSVLKRSTKPILQLVAPTMIASGSPLPYSIDTQSAPKGVKLEVTLVPASSSGSALSAATHRYPTARRHAVSMTAPSKPGDMTVVSTIGAWDGEFDSMGLSGHWRVVAVAIDEDGVIVARSNAEVMIDGEAPSRVDLTTQTPLVAGKPAGFRIDAADDLSGVDSVRLYLGYPIENAPPADAKPIVAAPLAGEPGAWSAALPMPAATTAVVTVEVTDRVGKVRNKTQQLVLIDEATAALGSVAGTVVEGVLPQPNLTVELRDPQQQPVASSKTDAKGAFHFAGVKPGKYLVWSIKAASQRVDAAAVDVQAGAEAKVDLRLSF